MTEIVEEIGCQTPLVELLERVPADARMTYEHHTTHHQMIPVGRLCQEAAAALRAYEVMARSDGWLPIESAPLETRIMLWCPENQRKGDPPRFTFGSVVQFSGGERKVYGDGMNGDWLFTHYRPLPDPPSSIKELSDAAG